MMFSGQDNAPGLCGKHVFNPHLRSKNVDAVHLSCPSMKCARIGATLPKAGICAHRRADPIAPACHFP